ncbi:hypothetical protein HDF18_13285 [Mucilaginibacter sp. X5P1]|uniref:hypothetical protein n=1 Tax=Mucilaginibacter sp. X5P1 TaxID=2723088 RepID=UPI00160AC98A|nr:hypothetical protein [Mucilaginibacter sp. X5P1]MBB6141685.1 hypothetical protein [Mucilaginibacter sp. X5P1]
MNEIKSLADQVRSKLAQPDTPPEKTTAIKKKADKPAVLSAIVEQLRAYDIANHKSMAHIRFDGQTAQMLHHFKMATGVEITRLVCFSVKQLFDQNPELKTIIKQHIQKLEL